MIISCNRLRLCPRHGGRHARFALRAVGQTLTTWIYQLHFGAVGILGLVYRVFVCVLGVAIAALSATGVWVWWVKRAKRVRQPPQLGAPERRVSDEMTSSVAEWRCPGSRAS